MDPSAITESRVKAGGVSFFMRSAGSGAPGRPVVVMVHGMIVSSWYWAPALRELAPLCTACAPDLPGYGRSQKLAHALPVPDLADALGAWMDAAGIASASMIGNSYGCAVVTEFAVRYPSRIRRAVLQGPTTDEEARRFLIQLLRFIRTAPYESPSLPLGMVRDYRAAGWPVVVETIRQALRDPIEKRLPLVRIPALVVRGTRDYVSPQRWAERVTSLLPDGRLAVIPGGGHGVNYSRAREFVGVIRPFLEL
ncbi:MAG: alpha/beta hydrolase [Nitrospirota bacterium]